MAALDHLLDEEVSLDAQDPRGFGPLHLAALHGQLRMAQRLLRAGCDPDLRDALNRTPRAIAAMRGFVDVAAEFAPLQSGVSMARFQIGSASWRERVCASVEFSGVAVAMKKKHIDAYGTTILTRQ